MKIKNEVNYKKLNVQTYMPLALSRNMSPRLAVSLPPQLRSLSAMSRPPLRGLSAASCSWLHVFREAR